MFVYLFAFALTILFIQRAAFYYNNLYKLKSTCFNNDIEQGYNKRLKCCRRKYYFFFLLAFFPLFFIAAVRYDVGTDYLYTYVPNFLKILNGDLPYSEWGFNQLNKFIQLFTTNPQWLFVITAFIFTFLIIQTIVRYSSNVLISVVVFFISSIFFIFLNNMRQLIAVVLFFRSYPYIKNGDFLKFLICLLCGMLFHLSAIIIIIPYVLVNLKFIRRNFSVFILVFTISLPVVAKLLELILFNTKYRYYFESSFNNGNATKINLLYNLFFFVFSWALLYKKVKTDKNAFILLFMQFMAFWVSASSLFINVSEMISRITQYFLVFQILLVPYCFKTEKNTVNKVAYLSSYILLYSAYLIYFIVINGYHQVLPYHWIF